MTVLLICADDTRLEKLKDAVHTAGFTSISARALDEGWSKTDFFDLSAVVIDADLKNDIAAAAFRKRYVTLNLNDECPPEAVGIELSELFRGTSGRLH